MRQHCHSNGWVLVPDANDLETISDESLQETPMAPTVSRGSNARPVLTRANASGSTTPHSSNAGTNTSVTAAAAFAELVAAAAAVPRTPSPSSSSSSNSRSNSSNNSQRSSCIYSSNSSYMSKNNSRRNSHHGLHDLQSFLSSRLQLSSTSSTTEATTTTTMAATTATTMKTIVSSPSSSSSSSIVSVRRTCELSSPLPNPIARVICDGITIEVTIAESTTDSNESANIYAGGHPTAIQQSSVTLVTAISNSNGQTAITPNDKKMGNPKDHACTMSNPVSEPTYCLCVNDNVFLYRTLSDFRKLDELLRNISVEHVNAAGLPLLDDATSIAMPPSSSRGFSLFQRRRSIVPPSAALSAPPSTQSIAIYLQCLLDAFGGPDATPASIDLLDKLRCAVHIFLELDILDLSTSNSVLETSMELSGTVPASPLALAPTTRAASSCSSCKTAMTHGNALHNNNDNNNNDNNNSIPDTICTPPIDSDTTKYDMQQRKMTFEDFELCHVLGRGAMGKVFLARDRKTRHHYALKSIAKHRLIERQELYHARSERDILATLTRVHHPFLIRLLYSFQDEDQLFLVLDYHRGGDIASELTRLHHFDEERVLFYAQQLVLGIAELHRLGIIYRDLKPENILITQDGHIVLTDFGLSKQFNHGNLSQKQDLSRQQNGELVDTCSTPTNESPNRSRSSMSQSKSLENENASTDTFCGTAEYLAPEVLMGARYSYAVDWWSLGTVLYEMMFGITPFWDDNHMIMYRRVMREPVQFPSSISEKTKSFLSRLLERNPLRRLGSGIDGARQVQNHPFFEATNWDQVINKQLPVPYVPLAKTPDDVQHFEEEFLCMTPQLSPVASYMRDFVSRRALDASAQICFEGFSFDERGLINGNNHHQAWLDAQSHHTLTDTTDQPSNSSSSSSSISLSR